MKISVILLIVMLFAGIIATAQPPNPPKGYKWVKNENLSDEFNGEKLDGTKWYNRSPYWVNGRPPATFRARTVSVKDGCLQIKNDLLREDDPKYHIAGGAVASVAKDAHYGYYESRLKASGISMSTTFWLKNKPEGDCPFEQQELDIAELVGMQKLKNDFRNVLHSFIRIVLDKSQNNVS